MVLRDYQRLVDKLYTEYNHMVTHDAAASFFLSIFLVTAHIQINTTKRDRLHEAHCREDSKQCSAVPPPAAWGGWLVPGVCAACNMIHIRVCAMTQVLLTRFQPIINTGQLTYYSRQACFYND